eukprot:929682_1
MIFDSELGLRIMTDDIRLRIELNNAFNKGPINEIALTNYHQYIQDVVGCGIDEDVGPTDLYNALKAAQNHLSMYVRLNAVQKIIVFSECQDSGISGDICDLHQDIFKCHGDCYTQDLIFINLGPGSAGYGGCLAKDEIFDYNDIDMPQIIGDVNGDICESPTPNPTTNPTSDPTNDPTSATTDPTSDPTTSDPSTDPTSDPTDWPTFDPTSDPTRDPTSDPTAKPTKSPFQSPCDYLSDTTKLDVMFLVDKSCQKKSDDDGPYCVERQKMIAELMTSIKGED